MAYTRRQSCLSRTSLILAGLRPLAMTMDDQARKRCVLKRFFLRPYASATRFVRGHRTNYAQVEDSKTKILGN